MTIFMELPEYFCSIIYFCIFFNKQDRSERFCDNKKSKELMRNYFCSVHYSFKPYTYLYLQNQRADNKSHLFNLLKYLACLGRDNISGLIIRRRVLNYSTFWCFRKRLVLGSR